MFFKTEISSLSLAGCCKNAVINMIKVYDKIWYDKTTKALSAVL